MGNRLTRIYTRTGDDGTTGLGDGRRVPKDDLRIEAYGTIDELNSQIGVVLAECPETDMYACLAEIQQTLFDVGGELCMPGHVFITEEHATWLEAWLDHWNEALPPLRDFILPGGGRGAAACHVARTVCRRAERLLVGLARSESLNPATLTYINRLSDLLFVACRRLARARGAEILWSRDRQRPVPR